MPHLSDKDINHLAHLANLPLRKQEKDEYKKQLSEVVSYVSQLSEVDTSNVEIYSHTINNNITRPDQVEANNILSVKQALRESQKTNNNYFLVPALLDKTKTK